MTRYIKYTMKNIEPLRIADNSSSQSGQTTTLRYIPGSAIRGWVINQLPENTLEKRKKQLFSEKVRFLNAYLTVNGKLLFPSPKGFYENKTGNQRLENVVINGEFTEGYKRAALGRYCCFEENCICYYGIDTESDMKIKINLENEKEKNNVFRNEYIQKGYEFTGYIAIDESDLELEQELLDTLGNMLILGNGRSQGLGKCVVQEKTVCEELPYASYMPESNQEKYCYMMLISNTAMRDAAGEYVGLNLKTLGDLLGVQKLEIEHCSTSVVNVRGYNRNWETQIPSVPMYEQGSVFKLRFDGTLTKEKMKEVMNRGIGIRKNEGFGRILFLGGYEKLDCKKEYSEQNLEKMTELTVPVHVTDKRREEENRTLKKLAKNYYKKILEGKMQEKILEGILIKGKVANSQVGTLRSLLSANKYNPVQAWNDIQQFFANSEEKEKKQNMQKARSSISELKNFVDMIQKKSLEKILGMDETGIVMGFSVKELLSTKERDQIKLQFLIDMISFENRKGE